MNSLKLGSGKVFYLKLLFFRIASLTLNVTFVSLLVLAAHLHTNDLLITACRDTIMCQVWLLY